LFYYDLNFDWHNKKPTHTHTHTHTHRCKINTYIAPFRILKNIILLLVRFWSFCVSLKNIVQSNLTTRHGHNKTIKEYYAHRVHVAYQVLSYPYDDIVIIWRRYHPPRNKTVVRKLAVNISKIASLNSKLICKQFSYFISKTF